MWCMHCSMTLTNGEMCMSIEVCWFIFVVAMRVGIRVSFRKYHKGGQNATLRKFEGAIE